MGRAARPRTAARQPRRLVDGHLDALPAPSWAHALTGRETLVVAAPAAWTGTQADELREEGFALSTASGVQPPTEVRPPAEGRLWLLTSG